MSPIRPMIRRLSRLADSDDWQDGLNPSQAAALGYLARANRFSRAPSQVADYFGATRGTVSQTLKSLDRKGLIAEHRSAIDKRRISFDLTAAGHDLLARSSELDAAIDALPAKDRDQLEVLLRQLMRAFVARQGGRDFGICAGCRHHRVAPDGARHCALLNEPLSGPDARLICHEFTAPAAA